METQIINTITKTKVHFTDNYLLNPTNPITINLIGAGGTGSQTLTVSKNEPFLDRIRTRGFYSEIMG